MAPSAPDDGQVTVWILALPDPRRAAAALRADGLPDDLVREPPFPLRTEPALAKRLEAAFVSAGARTVLQIGPLDPRIVLPPPEPGFVRILVVAVGPAADRLPHRLDGVPDHIAGAATGLAADPTGRVVELAPADAERLARLLEEAGATVRLVAGPPPEPPRPRRRRFRWR